MHAVRGPYEYYHYMQEKYDDKGWGCAYRSLQTIVSWYRLNGYATEKVPNHLQIQQALVKIGDKEPSFLGSKHWIGSLEVGYVLDDLLGVGSRVLDVASGPELADKARELARHFDEVGTPIMMGGGCLAFTLLGVDYNEDSGEVAFLILDPHYTGDEDLDIIQRTPVQLEGYKATPCGWRRADTFAKSFYNLCVPERPDLL